MPSNLDQATSKAAEPLPLTAQELDQLAALMRKRSALSSQRRPGTAGPAGAGGNAHLTDSSPASGSRERSGGERTGGNGQADILTLT